ncbi:MAG: TonB-dependent receptor [Sphingopyxis sp.]|uniref:TonB-dependent receptor n=1 Tax=Sphingopyxis sp. TaxID=1908224 RepID=UPI001A55C2F9|nr:TonB-dependent receptor [Sphingopyxis sp.]MBL9071957.1 TonB-dependent receptor [Sphingopyxis sp.]
MARKQTLILCVSALGLAHGTAAHAQEAGAQPADAANDATVQDIVVTAQKRSTLLQQTPAAITAVTGETLVERGISDLPAVQALVPSARFQIEQQSVQVFIRGVGASLDFANVQPVVALNLNGVSTPREGASAGFLDVAQIEVLPGPQGTLYGGTAMGGTVNINFNRPTDHYQTKLAVEGGNYDFFHVTAVQNIPVSNDLAIRGAVDYARHSGYQESGANSQNDFVGRLSALFTPSDAVSFNVWGSVATKNGHPINVVTRSFDATSMGLRNGAYLHANDPWDDTRTGALAALAPFGAISALDQIYHNYSVGAQLDAQLGSTTLTSITSYQYINSDQNFWLTSIPADLTGRYKQVTQEFRLLGEAGRLRWLAGLYGSRLTNSGAFALFGGGAYISNVTRNRLDNLSAFGELTYSASDRLRLTAGARASHFKREGAGVAYDSTLFDFDKSYRHVDFKVGIDYDIAPKVLVYTGFQTGYTPGTFNEKASSTTFDNAVKPSKLSAFSAGMKSRFLDNMVQLNLEGYYYRYNDLLQQSYDISAVFNPIFNAKRTEIYGAQADLVVKPASTDQFNLSLGYLHGIYKDFVQPNGTSYSGNSIAFAPAWTVTAGYSHDFTLHSGYIRARADARYESSYWGDFAHVAGDRLGNFLLVDASLTYYSENERWSFGIWGKNLSDKAVPGSSALGGIPGPTATQLGPPRTFGARLTFNY